jgi:hypothetical protein
MSLTRCTPKDRQVPTTRCSEWPQDTTETAETTSTKHIHKIIGTSSILTTDSVQGSMEVKFFTESQLVHTATGTTDPTRSLEPALFTFLGTIGHPKATGRASREKDGLADP